MSIPLAHFCENNFGFETEQLIEKLESEDYEVNVEPCMSHYEECAAGPIIAISDDLLTADSLDELSSKISSSF